MKTREFIASKMEIFYKEVETKMKGQKTRLQSRNLNKIFKNLNKKIFGFNKKYHADMFSMAVRGGKAFAAKQTLKELRKRIFRLKALKK